MIRVSDFVAMLCKAMLNFQKESSNVNHFPLKAITTIITLYCLFSTFIFMEYEIAINMAQAFFSLLSTMHISLTLILEHRIHHSAHLLYEES